MTDIPRSDAVDVRVAERLVEHLERSGFVIIKRPPPWAARRSDGVPMAGQVTDQPRLGANKSTMAVGN
jgi:hypothetical protein